MILCNPTLLQILLLLAFVVLAYLVYITFIKRKTVNEGFQQEDRFILKTNADAYDNFYGEIYDTLMLPKDRAHYEIQNVIQTVQPSKKHSIMLDVGSGTGDLIAHLRKLGYTAYGIDKSQAMVDIAHEKMQGKDAIKCADIKDPMTYDPALFTHIFCMNFTIYEIDNKSAFFENCHYWLKNNGYLIIHLADKDQFNKIIPAGNPNVGKPIAVATDKRIKNTFIDFADFTYKSEYIPSTEDAKQMVHKETFTDKKTQNIRQNERTLQMESMKEIIDIARRAGFIPKGEFTMENAPANIADKHQKIFILERI
jgi:SAM-dependent methyltransferase